MIAVNLFKFIVVDRAHIHAVNGYLKNAIAFFRLNGKQAVIHDHNLNIKRLAVDGIDVVTVTVGMNDFAAGFGNGMNDIAFFLFGLIFGFGAKPSADAQTSLR